MKHTNFNERMTEMRRLAKERGSSERLLERVAAVSACSTLVSERMQETLKNIVKTLVDEKMCAEMFPGVKHEMAAVGTYIGLQQFAEILETILDSAPDDDRQNTERLRMETRIAMDKSCGRPLDTRSW